MRDSGPGLHGLLDPQAALHHLQLFVPALAERLVALGHRLGCQRFWSGRNLRVENDDIVDLVETSRAKSQSTRRWEAGRPREGRGTDLREHRSCAPSFPLNSPDGISDALEVSLEG